jgi:hypothetical protein
LELTAVVQAKAGDSAGALVTLEGIKSEQPKWAALASIAHARAQHGDGASAQRMADAIEDASLQVEALADLAEVQAREGNLAEARRTSQYALERTVGIKSEVDRQRALAAAAISLTRLGDLDGARATAAQIRDRHIRMDVLGEIVEVQAQAGDWPEVQRTLSGVDRERRDQVLATRAVPSLAQRGDIDVVTEVAQALDDGFYRAMTLVRLADLQVKVGQPALAEQTFERIRRLAGELGGERDRDLELMSLTPSQAHSGDVAGASQTIAHMKRESLRRQALGLIAGALASRGNLAGARDVAAAIPEGPSRDNARWLVVIAQTEDGNLAGARELAGAMTDERLKSKSLVAIAVAQVKEGDFRGAQETVGTIPSEVHRRSAFMTVARVQTRRGDMAGPLAWAAALPDPLHRWSVLVGTASGLLPPSARCSTNEGKRLSYLCG